MSKKHFSGLVVAVVLVVLAVALLLPQKTSHDQVPVNSLMFPGLGQGVNDADALIVTGSSGESKATLERTDDGWAVNELSGYPADFSVLRPILAALSKAQVLELKTDNPGYYHRLGVEDIGPGNEVGVLLTLGIDGEEFAVILGLPASTRGGRYARLPGTASSLLVDFEAVVPADLTGWVDPLVADIATDDVAEVRISHADGEQIRVHKVSADDSDFILDDLPEGRELESSWAVNSLGGVLAGLNLDDVRPADEFDFSQAGQLDLLTFSGMSIHARVLTAESGDWIRLQATVFDTASEAEVTAAADSGGDAGGLSSTADMVAEFNRRVDGWAYRIPAPRAESMGQHMADLLKPVGEDLNPNE